MSVGRWRSRAATGLLGCLALATLTPPVAYADTPARGVHHRRDDPDADPLAIALNRLSPAVLPRKGPLVVTGTVRNTDTVEWTQVNLYPYLDDDQCVGSGTCSPPMTSSSALAEGAATEENSPVGERLTEESVKQQIPAIAPNQTLSFSITIPQSVLRSHLAAPQAGVYWFGVQAIGQSSTSPRDLIADGRARTFLPSIPAGYTGGHTGRSPLPTAVVVPVRAPIQHQDDGRLTDPDAWLASLSTGGSLADSLAIGRAAGGLPVTWLVDPAVVDAVQQLAGGNPARLLPTPGATGSGSPSATGLQGGTSGSGSAGPLAAAATSWLGDARTGFASGQLLALPYGDPALIPSDLTAKIYSLARARTGVLAGWRIPARRAVASPDGYLDPAGMDDAQDSAIALLGDRMLSRPVVGGTVGRHPFVTTSSDVSAGSPDPNQPLSSVGIRQRILAEAAARLASGDDRPLVVQLPQGMGAGGAAGFWAGLDKSWVDLTTVSSVLALGHADLASTALRFPDSDAPQPSQLDGQSEAQQLVQRGQLLQSIITAPKAKDQADATSTANSQLAAEVTGEALAGTSYSLAADAGAPGLLAASREWIDAQLAGVTLSAPPSVTLSSAEGSFAVTITNSLDVPVTVAVAAEASGAHIDTPDPVELASHSRASVRLDAHSTRAGVHNIRLSLTNTDGTPLGATATVPIRSGSVGIVIWAIIGTGAGILFFAIGVRLVRRFRRHRARGAEAG